MSILNSSQLLQSAPRGYLETIPHNLSNVFTNRQIVAKYSFLHTALNSMR